MDAINRLQSIMERLRAPDGCPWDREQTIDTLRTYLIEETFELAEAIDDGDWDAIREELGDLQLQVVFQAQLAAELGHFTLEDVANGISDKLVRRHPHVFGDQKAGDAAEAFQRWEAIKRQEKQAAGKAEEDAPRSLLAGLPRHLPSLVRAHRLADKAARVGFDWTRNADVVDKLEEEVAELRAVVDSDRQAAEEELGDLLFAAASLARRIGVDPEAALSRSCGKFMQRFARVETMLAERGESFDGLSPEAIDELWNRAKSASDATAPE